MESNYNKAFKEVTQILKRVPEESVKKIPKDMLIMFEEEMDKSYEFEIKDDAEFEDLELLEETKAILANIFRDYWATEEQRKVILLKEQEDRNKIEEEKAKKYNKDEIFVKRNTKIEEKVNNEASNLPVEIKKEKFYIKIVEFFKKIFKLN